MKTLRKKIIARLSAIPERQVSPGVYVSKVGRKYVHLLNTWERTSIEKMSLVLFTPTCRAGGF